MEPAAVVTILAVVVIIAVLVVYLIAVILELRKINSGLEVVIDRVGEVVRKSAPVNDIVADLNNNLDKGRDLLEDLLVRKAGVEDAAGLVESVFPGAGAGVLERHGRRGEVRNIGEVYGRGTAQLARLGRESPLGAAMSGPALRDPGSSSAAARQVYTRPGEDSPTKSPLIGTDAPAVYSPNEEIGAPRRSRSVSSDSGGEAGSSESSESSESSQSGESSESGESSGSTEESAHSE
jgi:uncharacterized membrane protein YgcG